MVNQNQVMRVTCKDELMILNYWIISNVMHNPLTTQTCLSQDSFQIIDLKKHFRASPIKNSYLMTAQSFIAS